MRIALLALALVSVGCGRAAKPGSAEPDAKTTVKVVNQSVLDMDVFVVSDVQRIRLGLIGGGATQVFTIPPDIVRSSPQVRFELHRIGSRANPRTETISMFPGDQVELVIPPR